MRLLLWLTVFIVCTLHLTQAGIYRRYVRRTRPRPRPYFGVPFFPMPNAMMMPQQDDFARREVQLYTPTPWPSFLFRRSRSPWSFPASWGFNQQPRTARNFRFPDERQDTVPNFHHKPHHHSSGPGFHPRPPMTSPWRPFDFGSNIGRDPTFDYAPPSMDRVRFHSEGQNRRITNGPAPHMNRPMLPPPAFSSPRPSLWKMLAYKQRPQKRPFHPRPQPQPQQAEHHVHFHQQKPNQVFQNGPDAYSKLPNPPPYRHSDVMYARRPPGPPHPMSPFGFPSRRPPPGPGLTSGIKGLTAPVPPQWSSIAPSPSRAPTTTSKPTVLHAVKTTPLTITTTHNSAVKPFTPTESFVEPESAEVHPNHKIHAEENYSDESAEESEKIEKVVKKQEKTTTITTTVSPTKKRQEDDGSSEEESSEIGKLNIVPPAPIFPNSFNILESVKDDASNDEESSEIDLEPENEIPGAVIEIPNPATSKPRPVFNNAVKNPSKESFKTSTSISVSVSKTDYVSTTPKPKPVRTTYRSTTTTSSTTPASTTTEGVTTTKPTKFPRLPTMPTYKKKPTPVYARKNKNFLTNPLSKYSSSSSSSNLAKEMNGSGEIVVITAGRSKVKEYKPQFIGENAQLISFDKVAEGSKALEFTTKASPKFTTPSPSTTTKSPLQDFDPLSLLHSWFTKSE